MPSRAVGGASTATSSKKFELPALDFKFGSLTDGTDIPPPLPSPVLEVPTPPKTPSPAGGAATTSKEGAKGPDEPQKDKRDNPTTTNGTITISAGTKRSADDVPLSPALSSRQGSIRRLFSRTRLNNTYEEGELVANGGGVASPTATRPGSRSNSSILDEKKAKRSSGWFRRLRSGDTNSNSSNNAAKRSSVYQEVTKPAGPPPPMIPEFTALSGTKLGSDDQGGLGGADLFKDIK